MMDRTNPIVLVADDEPGMLTLVSEHLKAVGYEVVEASDGEQAWAVAQDRLPDLVVLDVMMPAMSGWEVCRKIRETVALAHAGIIMLTGMGENLNELTSPLYGADDYIDKPFEFHELDQKVRSVLAKRAGQRSVLPGLARTEPELDPSESTPALSSLELEDDAALQVPRQSGVAPSEETSDGDEPHAGAGRTNLARGRKRPKARIAAVNQRPKAQKPAKRSAKKGRPGKGRTTSAKRRAPGSHASRQLTPKKKPRARSGPKAASRAKRAAKKSAVPTKSRKATASVTGRKKPSSTPTRAQRNPLPNAGKSALARKTSRSRTPTVPASRGKQSPSSKRAKR